MSNAREAAIAAGKRMKTATVATPLGDSFTLRELPAGKAIDLSNRARGGGESDSREVMIDWLIAAIVDEDGQQIFTDADRGILQEFALSTLTLLFTKALPLTNRYTPDQAEKNSEASPV